MKLDLRPMLADECRTLPIQYVIDLHVDTTDPSSSLFGSSFPSPMEVQGEIVNTAGYMRMTLNLSLDYVTPCARCLRDVAGKFTFTLEKTVAPRNLLENVSEQDLDDYAIIENGFLDMDSQLLELLEMEFPRKVLCKEDCAGLCPTCGKDLNEGPCTCKPKIDPRMAPLQQLLDEMRRGKSEN